MENAIAVETKFAYRHKPTGKWIALEAFIYKFDVCLHFIDEFNPGCAYSARNVIEEDFDRSILKTDLIDKKDEFELVEIKVQYAIK